ncbi:MAG: primosomal protein N' [Clostridia bacterium]|nr:primosomal protein N' [Clostridia bacterium]
MEYAGVYLLDHPYCLDRSFDYHIPPSLSDQVREGDFVIVPFGAANRPKIGLLVRRKAEPEKAGAATKPILAVCDRSLSLGEEGLGLCFFMKEQTLCTVGDAVRAMMPIAALSRPEEIYRISSKVEQDLTSLQEDAAELLKIIHRRQSVRRTLLQKHFGAKNDQLLKKLLRSGWILRDFELVVSEPKTEAFCSLAIDRVRADAISKGIDESIRLRSAAHLTVLRYLVDANEDEISEHTLYEACHVTRAQIDALITKGLVLRQKKTIDRSLPRQKKKELPPIVLSDEQAEALSTLTSLSDAGEPRAALLHGVTGSGKTSVMIKLIDHVLQKQKSAIVLLPEIALTPQTLEIFCSRYGDRVAILHSGLSAGERVDTHRRIREGGADVVIGTRSAVFAPLSNLGLIVIDEEQEHTYKSDSNPKYHARDIARYRCKQHGAMMLLASATPSFESYYKAKSGAYTLVPLKHRYGGAELPRVTVADMRSESSLSPLGALLAKKLYENSRQNNQSILFLNRRGYHNFVSCRSCGEAILCPTCSVSMTYHTVGNSYDRGELRCHWCGKRTALPETCPSCGSEHLGRMGFGTQRVEQELDSLLPTAKILRMDADSTTTKDAYEEMLGTFRRREADVLLGTQMVTKGHDFPDVTLVGVLSADASLYLDDYRAAERTFSMITQVIGRAGRAGKAGEAVIQTNNPDHECIRLACAQDYERFYDAEIRLRKLLVFPPFCDMVLLQLTSADEAELSRAAVRLSERLAELTKKEFSDVPTVSYGPFEAPVYKVESKYRMRMIVKCRLNKRSRALFATLLSEFSKASERTLTLSIDFNPSSL